MICKNCGSQLPDNSKHCPNCGNPVEVEQASVTNTSSSKIRYLKEDEKKKLKYFVWGTYACAFVGLIAFFKNGGFSLSFIWWIALALLLGVAYIAKVGKQAKDNDDLYAAKTLFGINAVIVVLMVVFASPSSTEEYVSSNDSSSASIQAENDIPDWIPGTWTCSTPYGRCNVVFMSGGSYIDNTDNKSGTYSYDSSSNRISTSTGSSYEVDISGKRIGIGGGYWMHKL